MNKEKCDCECKPQKKSHFFSKTMIVCCIVFMMLYTTVVLGIFFFHGNEPVNLTPYVFGFFGSELVMTLVISVVGKKANAKNKNSEGDNSDG